MCISIIPLDIVESCLMSPSIGSCITFSKSLSKCPLQVCQLPLASFTVRVLSALAELAAVIINKVPASRVHFLPQFMLNY